MTMNKKQILISLYGTGSLAIAIILIRMLIYGINTVMNLDAMLPLTYGDQAAFFLSILAIPIWIVSFLLFKQYRGKRRFLVFIPSIVAGYCFIELAVIMIRMFIKGFMLVAQLAV